MIHYSCDVCGTDLPAGAPRYTVRIEVYAAAEQDEVDPDVLEEPEKVIREMLDRTEQMSVKDIEDGNYRLFRYDLCRQCQGQYLQDPLGTTIRLRRTHSDN